MESNAQEKEWDKYWANEKNRKIYDVIASIYREKIIKRTLNYFIERYFKKDSNILHAGCGSGEVDTDIRDYIKITALDISDNALKIYKHVNGENSNTLKGDIFKIPFENEKLDGIYNLGVMEHFEETDVVLILKEFHRILKPNGRIIIFIPTEYGLSVITFKVLKFIFKYLFFNKDIKFHPDEICRIKSKKHALSLIDKGSFSYIQYYFGIKDFFTYAVIVAEKN
jgi:ubiquinone/menaquinone biosynthesis C-methylase UbiE